MFGRAIGRAGKQSYGRAKWPGGRAGQRQTMACLMRLSAVRMLSRGRATAPRGDDARIFGRRQRQITPMWLHISHSLRACGLFEAGCTRMRRSAEAPKCRVGTMLTYIAETCHTCASSSGCSARAMNCSTMRGQLGSISPAMFTLSCICESSANIFNTWMTMIDVDDRCSMTNGGRLSMVGESIIDGHRWLSSVDGRWSMIDNDR